MTASILVPFFAAVSCAEIAVLFVFLHVRVSRLPEHLVFSFLALFLAGMVGATLLLQERDAPGLSLLWFRLQMACTFLAVATLLHLVRRLAFPRLPLARAWLAAGYAAAAVAALLAWHPLVLHPPPAGTPRVAWDEAELGPLFYGYAVAPWAVMAAAAALAGRGLVVRRRADAEGGVRPFAPMTGLLPWILGGIFLMLGAAAVELLDLLGYVDLSVNPWALAVTAFCGVVAGLFGREIARSEQEKHRWGARARARLEAAEDVEHEVGKKLDGVRLPIEEVLGGGGLSDGQRRALESGLRLVDGLDRLLVRMLNTALAEAGRPLHLDLVSADPAALARDVWEHQRRLAAQAASRRTPPGPAPEFRFSAPGPPRARLVDRDLLTLVLENLLNNAVKYSPGGGVIELSVWEDDEGLHLAVSDEGVGVSPADRDRVFAERYFRSGVGREAAPGSGIGLHLVRRLVEAMGGEVRLVPRERGSRFVVRLPPPAPGPAAPPADSRQDGYP